MKNDILLKLEEFLKELKSFRSTIDLCSCTQITKASHLEKAKRLGRVWFNEIKPQLENITFNKDKLIEYSEYFRKLLGYSAKSIRTTSYLTLMDAILENYSEDIINEIEISNIALDAGPNIAPYLEDLQQDEKNYLGEAAQCATQGCLRACIVLGWCATVYRIHKKIELMGFDNFNKATREMKEKTFGRYKKFNNEYKIESISELREVFDTHLLWAIEYMGLIDGNQHERLRHCFLLRNNCAHPGDAPISGENLYSFYSDITKIVLKNPKFN